MANDTNKPKPSSRPAPKQAEQTAEAQHPADSELRFQHVIRNMVVARDRKRRKSGLA